MATKSKKQVKAPTLKKVSVKELLKVRIEEKSFEKLGDNFLSGAFANKHENIPLKGAHVVFQIRTEDVEGGNKLSTLLNEVVRLSKVMDTITFEVDPK